MFARIWPRYRHLLLRAVAILLLVRLARPVLRLNTWGGIIGPRFSLQLPGLTIPYAGLLLGSVWPGLLFWALTLLFGRFFCAWICPLGLASDLFELVARRYRGRLPVHVPEPSWRVHHALHWAAIPYGALVNGLGVLWPSPGSWSLLVGAALFVLPMGLSMLLVNGRVPCRYFCTIQGIGALVSPVTIRRRADRCTGCGRCERDCFMRVRLLEPGNAYDKTYCARCGLCLDACPEGALSWGLGWSRGVATVAGPAEGEAAR